MKLKVFRRVHEELKETLGHPLASSVRQVAMSQFIAGGLALVGTVVAVRILGPAEYGMAAVVIAYPTLVWSFVGVKSVSVTTRYIAVFLSDDRHSDVRAICKAGYLVDLAVSVLTLILIIPTAKWALTEFGHAGSLRWFAMTYAASFLFYSLSGTSTAVLSSLGDFRILANLRIFEAVLRFITITGALIAGLGLRGMIVAMAITQVVTGVSMTAVATRQLRARGIGPWWTSSLESVRPLRRELWALFGWNYLITTLNSVLVNVPVLFLGRLRGPSHAGFYRAATNMMTGASYIEAALGRVVYPVLAVRWASSRDQLRSTLRRWFVRAGLPMSLTIVALVPLLPVVIPLLLGNRYEGIVGGTQLLMLAAAVNIALFFVTQGFYASGRIAILARGSAVHVALVTGLVWFTSQQWGFTAAAAVVAIGSIVFRAWMAFVFVNELNRGMSSAGREKPYTDPQHLTKLGPTNR